MHSGRGAKGSINDRIISMLYRQRYKLQERKKAGYKKEEKAKQKEYLQTIKDFDIEEDVTNLDDQDKAVVEEVFNVSDVPSSTVATVSKDDTPIPFTKDYQEKVTNIESSAAEIENTASEPKVDSLHDLSNQMIEVDLTTEVFDFDHYDYYEVLAKTVGIADYPESEMIEPEKEIEKVDDEEVILEELSTFIEDSKEKIVEIKEEIEDIQQMIPESKTENQVDELERRYVSLRAKVDLLKKQYDVIKEKYDFEDYEILNSIEMMSAIEDYHDKASLDELETLVDSCKEEVDQIDEIIVEERRTTSLKEEVVEQRKAVEERDHDFHQNQQGVIYLDEVEKQIAEEARLQSAVIRELEEKLNQFSSEVEMVTRTVYHTERLFGSFLRIAAGILTVPFNGRHVFGTMLGTHLINRGIRQLRDSLNPEFVQTPEVRYRYQSIEREILNSKDYVNTTELLIDDSLRQLDQFDEEFKTRFQEYTSIIPQYKEVEEQIQSLKVRLQKKKEDVKVMQKDLDRQYEQNKQKVMRASQ